MACLTEKWFSGFWFSKGQTDLGAFYRAFRILHLKSLLEKLLILSSGHPADTLMFQIKRVIGKVKMKLKSSLGL